MFKKDADSRKFVRPNCLHLVQETAKTSEERWLEHRIICVTGENAVFPVYNTRRRRTHAPTHTSSRVKTRYQSAVDPTQFKLFKRCDRFLEVMLDLEYSIPGSCWSTGHSADREEKR